VIYDGCQRYEEKIRSTLLSKRGHSLSISKLRACFYSKKRFICDNNLHSTTSATLTSVVALQFMLPGIRHPQLRSSRMFPLFQSE